MSAKVPNQNFRLPKHPGRTPAQRRVLDAIGCGDNAPWMTNQTRDAMLKAGLIVQCADKLIPLNPHQPSGLQIHITQFEMPIPIHMRWCDHWAAQSGDDHEGKET